MNLIAAAWHWLTADTAHAIVVGTGLVSLASWASNYVSPRSTLGLILHRIGGRGSAVTQLIIDSEKVIADIEVLK